MSKSLDLACEVVNTLKKKNKFITTVESCTGGGLSNIITNISGASEVITSARVTYSNNEKVRLGVSQKLIEEFTVYSTEIAKAMAKVGIQNAEKADIGVGITGSISRIDPNNPNSKPGEVYIAVEYGDIVISDKFIFSDEGERCEVKDKAIIKALRMVLNVLNDA